MSEKLRIAVFVYEFPALSETFVINQITGLIELGHDVTVFAERRRADPLAHGDIHRYRLADHTHYLNLPRSRLVRAARAPWLGARRLLGRPRTALGALDVARFGREALSLRLFYWAARLAQHRPFDILHCHFGQIGALVARLRAIGAVEGRLVTTFHGADMSAELRRDQAAYGALFRAGELFLPVSRRWADRLAALGCDPARIRVHRMGVEPERFPFRARRPAPGAPLRLLSVGRLVEKKGIAVALRAVARAVAAGMAVRYTIVGDGPLRRPLETLVSELRLDGQVGFRGWQDQTNVRALMATHDILLAPSLTDAEGDQEGIPVTIMEAMASGMVVVASRHSAIPELVEHGVSGWLVPEGDGEALFTALQELSRQRGWWAPFGHAARARIEAEHDVARLNRTLAQCFRAVAAAPAMRGADPTHAVGSCQRM